jgi:hypothetical protein
MLTVPPTQLAAKSSARAIAQCNPRTLSAAAAFHAVFLFLSAFLLLEPPSAAWAQTTGEQPVAVYSLPDISIQHLRTLTDETGIHEFAHGTIPWHENGYCAEDVGRALAAVTLYEEVTGKIDGRSLARVYLAYLQKSLLDDGNIWNREQKTMASGDAYGRILWGLGCAASFQTDQTNRDSAARLFERILPGWERKLGDYPIARACAMQGLADFLKDHSNPDARAAMLHCAELNLMAFRKHSAQNWNWFDETMTYDSGRLPLSLLMAFQMTGDSRFRDAGLASLKFLLATCFDAKGTRLSLVGNQGWFKRGGTPARFDQQPIDAAAMVEACVLAARLTGKPEYARRARTAFEWFLGNNAEHAVLYDAQSGGCRDGLTKRGPNSNEGGESTIMYVIARCSLENLLYDSRRK